MASRQASAMSPSSRLTSRDTDEISLDERPCARLDASARRHRRKRCSRVMRQGPSCAVAASCRGRQTLRSGVETRGAHPPRAGLPPRRTRPGAAPRSLRAIGRPDIAHASCVSRHTVASRSSAVVDREEDLARPQAVPRVGDLCPFTAGSFGVCSPSRSDDTIPSTRVVIGVGRIGIDILLVEPRWLYVAVLLGVQGSGSGGHGGQELLPVERAAAVDVDPLHDTRTLPDGAQC